MSCSCLDNGSLHIGDAWRKWLANNYPNVILLFIPAGCTGWLQPLDLTFNLALKRLLKHSAGMWLASTMQEQLSPVADPSMVKLCLDLSYLKPFFCGWIASAMREMDGKMRQVMRGWDESGMGLAFSLAQDQHGNFDRTTSEFKEAVHLQESGELSAA